MIIEKIKIIKFEKKKRNMGKGTVLTELFDPPAERVHRITRWAVPGHLARIMSRTRPDGVVACCQSLSHGKHGLAVLPDVMLGESDRRGESVFSGSGS